MDRREALATLGTGALATTGGCLGMILGTDCKPGDPSLASLYDRVMDMEDPGRVSVRGTVTRMETVSMVIADGTGYAEISAPFGKKFNSDWFETGDCVSVTASVAADFSREYGYLEMEIESGEDIETEGPTNDPPDPPPTEPDVFFELSFQDGGVTFEHTGSEPVPASDLEVRSRPETDLQIYPWEEFTDADPDTMVEPGDTAVFDRRNSGHLIWKPEKYWGDAVSSAW